MIKKLTLLLAACIPFFANAQLNCSGTRYHDELFSAVTVTSDVQFGSSKDYLGNNTTLKMDIYQPTGDTVSIRPVIMWAHGGSFIGGTKTDQDVATLATRFAKRGYVCVSYEYRLGFFPVDQANASQAVYRATQDAKAAVRFMRKSASTTNPYKIDAGHIYLGGSSAGAFIALHYAYLDQQAEVPSYIDTTGIGDLEGKSGNPGYCSDISAIIGLCGALGSKDWMQANEEPVCLMHGTNDNTVPYATAMDQIGGFPIMVVDGSHTIDSMATALGIEHTFHTWIGADHVPYAGTTATPMAYMDSTVEFVRDFLCNQISKAAICPVIASGIEDTREEQIVRVMPTLVKDEFSIQNFSGEILQAEIMDVNGRIIRSEKISSQLSTIHKGDASSGIYFLRITGKRMCKVEKLIFAD